MVAFRYVRLSLIKAVARRVLRDAASGQGIEPVSSFSKTDCLVNRIITVVSEGDAG